MKNKKKLILAPLMSVVGIASITSALTTTLIKNNYNDSITLGSVESRAFGTGGDSSSSTVTFDFKSKNEIKKLPWYGKKKANEITNDELKQIIDTKGAAVNFTVSIVEPDATHINQGYLDFYVYKYNSTTSKFEEVPKPNNSGAGAATKENATDKIWTTKEISELSGLILPDKYNLIWNDPEIIEEWIMSTTKKASDITEDEIIKYAINPKSNLPQNIKNIMEITTTITPSTTKATDDYGIIKVSFKENAQQKTNNTNWMDNKLPSEYILRGFIASDGKRHKVEVVNNVTDVSNVKVSKSNFEVFGNAFNNDEFGGNQDPVSINNITASQFVNLIGGKDMSTSQLRNDASEVYGANALMKMLTEGLFLDGKQKFIDIKYMGNSYLEGESFYTNTGIQKQTNSKNQEGGIKVKDIQTIPNDEKGSLEIIYTINYYDVFTNQYEDLIHKQIFPENSFKKATQAENLSFTWKTMDAIPVDIGNSFSVVNQFKQNNDDKEFVKVFSNQFFYGSDDVYSKDRIVNINYKGGGHLQNDDYVADQIEAAKIIEIEIIFEDWLGSVYTDNSGAVKKGFKTKAEFDLNTYNNSAVSPPKWEKSNELIKKNPIFYGKFPSEITKEVFSRETPSYDEFYKFPPSVTYSAEPIFIPNDTNGTLTVKLPTIDSFNSTNKDPVWFTQIFTGMKASNTNENFEEFGWLPSTDIDPKLLQIPLYQVQKKDVIDLYLKKIPMFANSNISENDVTIAKYESEDYKFGELEVMVKMARFGAGSSISDQGITLKNRISGFSTSQSSNLSNVTPPKDNTALISVSAAVGVSVVLSIILIALISRRAKIRKFN